MTFCLHFLGNTQQCVFTMKRRRRIKACWWCVLHGRKLARQLQRHQLGDKQNTRRQHVLCRCLNDKRIFLFHTFNRLTCVFSISLIRPYLVFVHQFGLLKVFRPFWLQWFYTSGLPRNSNILTLKGSFSASFLASLSLFWLVNCLKPPPSSLLPFECNLELTWFVWFN